MAADKRLNRLIKFPTISRVLGCDTIDGPTCHGDGIIELGQEFFKLSQRDQTVALVHEMARMFGAMDIQFTTTIDGSKSKFAIYHI
jgi:hypothetical protein